MRQSEHVARQCNLGYGSVRPRDPIPAGTAPSPIPTKRSTAVWRWFSIRPVWLPSNAEWRDDYRRNQPRMAALSAAALSGPLATHEDLERVERSGGCGPNTAACGGSTASGPSAGGDGAWTNLVRSISSPNMAAAGREGRNEWSGCGRGRCLYRSRHQHGGEPRRRRCRLGHPFVARV